MGTKKIKTHKDLDVWKKSMEFAEKLYTLTATLPKEKSSMAFFLK
jgi:hypothetical protein